MIRLTFDNSLAVISLNRPEKKNALTPPMLDALRSAIAQVASAVQTSSGPRALVFLGEGDTFCAGFDLPLCHADPLVLPQLLTGLSHACRALKRLPIPVVIGAHGAAIAGGCALLGGGDIVVTDAGAKLGYPVVRLGVSPAVTAPLLRLMIGDSHTRERLLGGSLFSGQQAFSIGLAHDVVAAPADVRARAIELAQALAAKPAPALRATRELLSLIDGSDTDAAFDAALAASISLVGGHEQHRLLGAFVNAPRSV